MTSRTPHDLQRMRADSAPHSDEKRCEDSQSPLTNVARRGLDDLSDQHPGQLAAGTLRRSPEAALLTTSQVAPILGVHRNTVDNERKAGRLCYVKIGTCVRFTMEQVEEYIKSQHRKEAPPPR